MCLLVVGLVWFGLFVWLVGWFGLVGWLVEYQVSRIKPVYAFLSQTDREGEGGGQAGGDGVGGGGGAAGRVRVTIGGCTNARCAKPGEEHTDCVEKLGRGDGGGR